MTLDHWRCRSSSGKNMSARVLQSMLNKVNKTYVDQVEQSLPPRWRARQTRQSLESTLDGARLGSWGPLRERFDDNLAYSSSWRMLDYIQRLGGGRRLGHWPPGGKDQSIERCAPSAIASGVVRRRLEGWGNGLNRVQRLASALVEVK